tara:strand:- start:81 stop:581 length:501 start_codon:yes stop_codon:yes gene_type:complete
MKFYLRILVFSLFGLFLLFQTITKLIDWSEWLSWYYLDRTPLEFNGNIKSVETLTGRWHSGDELFLICNEDKCIKGKADIENESIKNFRAINNIVQVYYVPLPTGSNYLLQMKDLTTGEKIYERLVVWDVFIPVAIGVLLLILFLFFLTIFIFLGIRKELKGNATN